MIIVGAIIFYLGFFGLFVGVMALIRGNLSHIKINNRRQAVQLIGISIVLVMVGALIVGPESKQTAVIQMQQISFILG